MYKYILYAGLLFCSFNIVTAAAFNDLDNDFGLEEEGSGLSDSESDDVAFPINIADLAGLNARDAYFAGARALLFEPRTTRNNAIIAACQQRLADPSARYYGAQLNHLVNEINTNPNIRATRATGFEWQHPETPGYLPLLFLP